MLFLSYWYVNRIHNVFYVYIFNEETMRSVLPFSMAASQQSCTSLPSVRFIVNKPSPLKTWYKIITLEEMWEDDSMKYRDELLKVIHDNVKICQSKFGGRTLLATETETSVVKVLNGFELILQDRLKSRNGVNLKHISLNVNNFSLRF